MELLVRIGKTVAIGFEGALPLPTGREHFSDLAEGVP